MRRIELRLVIVNLFDIDTDTNFVRFLWMNLCVGMTHEAFYAWYLGYVISIRFIVMRMLNKPQ